MSTREPITIDEAFDGLPDEIRASIHSSNWQEKLRRISGSRNLRVDQGAALEDETLRFMAGLQTVEEYAVHLAQEITLPQQDFQALVAEIEREIFVPIQAKLKDILPKLDEGAAPAAASVGENEEDDLEALLNEGEGALAEAAALVPNRGPVPSTFGGTPAQPSATSTGMVAKPISAPILATTPAPSMPAVAPATKPTPIIAQPVALSAAAAKLSAPVVRPVETVIGNLQRPAANSTPATTQSSSSTPASPSPSDPYREPVL